MSFDTIQWHFYLGYFTIALIAFRLLWGVIGPKPVRFRTMFRSFSTLGSYIRRIHRRSPSGTPGHNPLGALSVFAMLTLIAIQGMAGLFVESEDFFESGPFAEYVSQATIVSLTNLHHTIADILFVVVALHVAAILFYLLWKKENLIKPMINGWKTVTKKETGIK